MNNGELNYQAAKSNLQKVMDHDKQHEDFALLNLYEAGFALTLEGISKMIADNDYSLELEAAIGRITIEAIGVKAHAVMELWETTSDS